jgi:aconitate hydratase
MADLTAKNSFGAKETFETGSGKAYYYCLSKLQEAGLGNIDKMPFSIKVLLESLLRNENGWPLTTRRTPHSSSFPLSQPGSSCKTSRVCLRWLT